MPQLQITSTSGNYYRISMSLLHHDIGNKFKTLRCVIIFFMCWWNQIFLFFWVVKLFIFKLVHSIDSCLDNSNLKGNKTSTYVFFELYISNSTIKILKKKRWNSLRTFKNNLLVHWSHIEVRWYHWTF